MMKKSDNIETSYSSPTKTPTQAGGNKMAYFIKRYKIEKDDTIRIKNTIYPSLKGSIDDMIVDFYVWLEKQPEYKQFFKGNKELINRVKKAQIKYWTEILSSELDNDFFDKRMSLATTHARINLSLDSYFAGLAFFMNWVLDACLDSISGKNSNVSAVKKEKTLAAMSSFIKVLQIDQAIVTDNYVKTTSNKLNDLIQRQASTITKLATPIALLAEDILLISIIGIIDSNRSQEIMETTLTKIVDTTSRVAIVDIAGVDMIDTSVANHLIKMTQAIKLMGCTCILSGVSPVIAQTVINLGVDLKDLTTKAVLKDAVEMANRIVQEQKKGNF